MNEYIKIIYPQNKEYMENMGFIRAFFIKKYIESLDTSINNKRRIFNEILQYLKNN